VLVSLHHKNPTGLVDHFAIASIRSNKERVTGELKRIGLTPQENIDAGFHIIDPEGMRVRLFSRAEPEVIAKSPGLNLRG